MKKSEWLDEISVEEALEIQPLFNIVIGDERNTNDRLFTDQRRDDVWDTDGFRLWRCHICDHTWPEGREDCHNCWSSSRPLN